MKSTSYLPVVEESGSFQAANGLTLPSARPIGKREDMSACRLGTIRFGVSHEPPYTERYVRWCGGTEASRLLLPDHRISRIGGQIFNLGITHPYCLTSDFFRAISFELEAGETCLLAVCRYACLSTGKKKKISIGLFSF